MSEIEFIRIDRNGLDDDQWREFYDLLRRLRDRYSAPLVSPDWQTLKSRLLAAFADMPTYAQVVFRDQGAMVGWLDVRQRGSDDSDATYYTAFGADFDTVPAQFVRVAGEALLSLLEPAGASVAYTMTSREEMSRLAQQWGGVLLSRLDQYRLNRADLDEAVIARWCREGAQRNPDLRVISFKTVPEEHLDRYCELYETFLRDMPKEGEDNRPFRYSRENHQQMEKLYRAQGTVVYTVALIDQESRIVAHTNVLFYGDSPHEIHQMMTGVAGDYRGRGLGKWLKAELFTRLAAAYPSHQILTTEMRAINEPILAINRELGYRPTTRGHEIRIPVPALEQFVTGGQGR